MRLLYKPVGLTLSVVGAQIAARTFKSIWAMLGNDKEAPKSTDRDRTWREVLLAAALQGAVFGGVKAAIDRFGATRFEQLTGVWPGRTKTRTKSSAWARRKTA
jgi:hypothetical protein